MFSINPTASTLQVFINRTVYQCASNHVVCKIGSRSVPGAKSSIAGKAAYSDAAAKYSLKTMRIGLISDTHDFLDRKVFAHFRGVNGIVHGGDVGLPWLLSELETIAPVTAVLGNTDGGINLKETEVVEFDGKKLLVSHIVNPHSLPATLAARITREKADVVVYGHTHKPFCETIAGTLFVNPGYAGRQRFNLPRTIAILHTRPALNVEFMSL